MFGEWLWPREAASPSRAKGEVGLIFRTVKMMWLSRDKGQAGLVLIKGSVSLRAELPSGVGVIGASLGDHMGTDRGPGTGQTRTLGHCHSGSNNRPLSLTREPPVFCWHPRKGNELTSWLGCGGKSRIFAIFDMLTFMHVCL